MTWCGLALLLVACAVVAIATVDTDASGYARVKLRIEVSGTGLVAGNGRTCSQVCTWEYKKGTVVRLAGRPQTWNRFAGWGGGCAGAKGCAIRMSRSRMVKARFASLASLPSWNSHVGCKAVLTTLETILGNQESAQHGATEAGGGFQPHLRGDEDRHLLNAPCTVGGTPTFVEIDNIVVAETPEFAADGDYNANLVDPNRPDITNEYMRSIHAEEDGTWFKAGVGPALLPAKGTKIDVQGFLYWDPAHTTELFHSFSGWELHGLAAWRPATP